jgi:peptide/nickel transport system substrate-binding protein
MQRLTATQRVLRPSCQLLSPGLPGYEPTCPFVLRPRTGSAATAAPDLDRARRLVARSQTAGTRVAFRAPADNHEATVLGRAFVRLLNAIGFRARLAAIPQRDCFARTQDPRARMQMGWAVWLGESPAASKHHPAAALLHGATHARDRAVL